MSILSPYPVVIHKPPVSKAIIILIVLSALSPSIVSPDSIPFIGYLDDLVIGPGGIALAISLRPKDVWNENRERTKTGFADLKLNSLKGVLLILFISRE